MTKENIMIKRITLSKYKCYNNSNLTLKEIVIIVGSNNSGKSTLIEALRMVADAAKRYRTTNYIELPSFLNLPKIQKGFRIPVEELKIDLRSAIYNYQSAIATIDVEFESAEHIVIFLNNQYAYACIKNRDGQFIRSKKEASNLNITSVVIMPQISLLRDDESVLGKETIVKSMGTRHSSRHFRNELLLYRELYYDKFVRMAQSTWPKLRIQSLEPGYGEDPIALMVYDGEFSAEIASMGSGLQMWLQIIWFLSRCGNNDTIILDEPDVYMHPDMQHKIYEYVASNFSQVIIATHSVEIISSTNPKNIVTIDRDTRRFSYACDLKSVQEIVDNIGGVHNLALIRIGSKRKCVFVEGKDLNLLSKIYKNIYPKSETSLLNLPCVSLGGKGNIDEAFGTARLFFDETDGQVKTVCILDRDYSLPDEVEEYERKAKEKHLELHIWKKKEIESYIVTPKIVFCASGLSEQDRDLLYEALDECVEAFKLQVTDLYASRIKEVDKTKSLPTCNQKAREYVDSKWTDLESKMSLVNGKELITAVLGMIKKRFGIELRKADLIRSINCDTASQELLDVLALLVN